jgi:hypothetical protein
MIVSEPLIVAGFFKSPSEGEKQGGRTLHLPGAKVESVSVVLDKIAKKKGVPITSVGLAYVMHKGIYHITPAVSSRANYMVSQHRTHSQS